MCIRDSLYSAGVPDKTTEIAAIGLGRQTKLWPWLDPMSTAQLLQLWVTNENTASCTTQKNCSHRRWLLVSLHQLMVGSWFCFQLFSSGVVPVIIIPDCNWDASSVCFTTWIMTTNNRSKYSQKWILFYKNVLFAHCWFTDLFKWN